MVGAQPTAQAFDISDWRRGVKARREMVRSLIVRAVNNGEQLEPILNDFREALQHHRLNDEDRNLLNVIFHDIRTVVGRWRHLPVAEQQAFIAGKGAPSSVTSRLRRVRS